MTSGRIISLDTETTGLDVYHGARPFFVTICDQNGSQEYWEWPVNPFTRMPEIPLEDIYAIQETIRDCSGLILQNTKFDYAALREAEPGLVAYWDWSKVRDTLLAGHILASNQPHNLTDMAIHYLGVNIEKFEVRLRDACNKARRYCRSNLKDWRIAKKGLDEMPSAGDKCWKFDTWLPRALVKHLWETSDAGKAWTDGRRKKSRELTGWEYHPPEVSATNAHPWWTILRDYANMDSAVTIELWEEQRKEIERRQLMPIYMERLRVLPIAAKMEECGVTVSGNRIKDLIKEYSEGSKSAENVCVNIAAAMGYDLEVPKGGMNKSLAGFCFGLPKEENEPGLFPPVQTLDLPVLIRTDKGQPSLKREALVSYLNQLPPKSRAYAFLKSLGSKRQRDTAISYMNAYKRFWLPWVPAFENSVDPISGAGWYVLHPSLNPTGTDTLRWSSSHPNEQNVSKKENFNLRYGFGPAPGREWWSLDMKNIELRIPTYESGEEEFIALFERPDDPPYFGSNHLLIAHLLWPEEFEECINPEHGYLDGRIFKKKYASTLYQRTKNGNFAVQYGAVDKADGTGKADRTYGQPGAQAKIKARFAKQDALNQWCIRFAEKNGYIETLPDRTVDANHGYPLLCTRTDTGRIKPTVPLNYRVQGTACWLMQKCMILCQDKLDSWNQMAGKEEYLMIIQVHDELVFDFPKSKVHPKIDAEQEKTSKKPLFRTSNQSNLWRIRIIQKLMESTGENLVPCVPTPVSVEYHDTSWAEGESL